MINVVRRYTKYGQQVCHVIHYEHPSDPIYIILGMDEDKLVEVGTSKTLEDAEKQAVDFTHKI